ncbi:MAG: hypothetical protein JWO67_7207 [Streptosporangiaceae bacterium]|nr:hypothetical protein [Streptosporangiaceae bacterium]
MTELNESGVEEIDVPEVPEPDEAEDGVIDSSADTHREGVDAE